MNGVSGRRRTGRAPRESGGIQQRGWAQLRRPYAPIEILSADRVQAIHEMGLTILEEIGMRVLQPEARRLYRSAGADVSEDDMRVRFDRTMVMERIRTAPSNFELRARNPARNLKVGGEHCIFSSVGGPAYVMDNDRGRRPGTYAEMCDYLKLIQSFNVLHQEGGGPFEPLDLPANTRHLDLYYAEVTLLDKNWQPQTLGIGRTIDALEMLAISLGTTREGLAGQMPAFTGIINTNSPLQLDVPMAEGLIALAEHGQVNVITPFTLAGAMSPVTLAGALAQQHAEALAGIVLTQIVRPGVPVMYGGFTSNVDMRSGAPAFGTPEYTQAAQITGQLCRLVGIPFRSSNVTAANAVDAQAAYESAMSLWGCLMGGAHLVLHAAGWLGGGLTASFEKLVVDAEMLQMMAAYFEPPAVDADALAFDAVREVGPAGHFFGAAHTMQRYERAFYAPLLSNWDNHDTWVERGQVTARERANTIWKRMVSEYQQPPIDPGMDEALRAYRDRRKREGGSPLN
ncbi:MAG TPA: trimethylamine methyltransferase family protein [Mesorhizobium sp.]|jgi:trimethylamine--corrinoid protein Co-methyltransferase|nr:trimethylamine methyltransferase family protein [Mesorhizobium sp.]